MALHEYHLAGRKSYQRVGSIDFSNNAEPSEIELFPPAKHEAFTPKYVHIASNVESLETEKAVRSRPQPIVPMASSFLVNIPNGRILTDGFFVADRHNSILSDSFRALGTLQKFGFREIEDRVYSFKPASSAFSSGINIVLGAQTNKNYFHWLFESLSRTVLFAPLNVKNVKIIVPRLTRWMRESLDIIGVDASTLLTLDSEELVCEHLLFPARGLSSISTFAPHSLMFIDLWIERNSHTQSPLLEKRLFVSRQGANNRYLANEDEIFSSVQDLGFIKIYPERFSLAEQVAIFQNATFVVGPLGAGLTNIAFMNKDSGLLELAPEGRTGDALLFSNLACLRGMEYGYMVGKQIPDGKKPKHLQDFTIDKDIFREAVISMLR